METPLIHFDRFLGLRPEWRQLMADALQGNQDGLRQEVLLQGSARPSVAVSLQAAFNYARCGQQVYVVGPKYQRMFADTSCDEIPDIFFKLPHECFYIALPECEHCIWEEEFGYHPIAGVYVYQATPKDILFIMWGRENDNATQAGDDTLFWVRLEPEQTPSIEAEDGVRILNFDKHLENVLSYESHEVSDPGMEIPADKREFQVDAGRMVIRIAINTILQLTSEGAEIEVDHSLREKKLAKAKNIKKKLDRKKARGRDYRKAKEKLDSMSEAVIIWLGKTAENDPKVRIPRRGEKGRGGATWVARKGHRHHYWMGKRHINAAGKRVGERLVQKWVAPVYRLPGDTDAPTREHRFIGEKDDYRGGDK